MKRNIEPTEKEKEIMEFVEQLRKKYPNGFFPDDKSKMLNQKIRGLVPKMKEEKLRALALYIRPVHRFSRNPETDELFHDANSKLLFYDPSITNPYDWKFQSYFQPRELAIGLKECEEIGTYHEYAASVMCRASVADVISQLPKKLIGRVVAFEINHLGSPDEYEKTCPLGYLPINYCFHYARTRLYEK